MENSVINSEFNKNLTFLGNQKVENQTIIINQPIIKNIQEIVISELNGNVNFSPEEQQINILIDKYGKTPSEINELKNYIYEIKDEDISNDEKRTAWKKLQGFLYKVGEKVGDVGITLLVKYLEQKMQI